MTLIEMGGVPDFPQKNAFWQNMVTDVDLQPRRAGPCKPSSVASIGPGGLRMGFGFCGWVRQKISKKGEFTIKHTVDWMVETL